MYNDNLIKDLLDDKYIPIVNIVVVEELDHLKEKKDDIVTAHKAQKALIALKTYKENIKHDTLKTIDDVLLDSNKVQGINNINDDIIISCAKRNDAYIATRDYNLVCKGDMLGVVEFVQYKEKEEYDGFKSIILNNDEMAYFYEHLDENIYNCLINEYVLVYNTKNELIDKLCWTGDKYRQISYRNINNDYVGKITPRNPEQQLAFDLLQNKNIPIKILGGEFGSGKDYLMVSHAIDMIKNKKSHSHIVWIRNNIEVKDSNPIGYLPSDMNAKLLPFAMPLADHLGGKSELLRLIEDETIQIEHLGFIRGRDIKDSIVICSEAENMSQGHIQLLISRISENSTLWINGDLKQVDTKKFENDNGFRGAVNCLKGNPNFGYVKLKHSERSEVARMADLLDY